MYVYTLLKLKPGPLEDMMMEKIHLKTTMLPACIRKWLSVM